MFDTHQAAIEAMVIDEVTLLKEHLWGAEGGGPVF